MPDPADRVNTYTLAAAGQAFDLGIRLPARVAGPDVTPLMDRFGAAPLPVGAYGDSPLSQVTLSYAHLLASMKLNN